MSDIKQEIYFDNNATTPVCDEAREAVALSFDHRYANPSSYHAAGARARFAIETARENVAGLIGASPGEIFFTSSGTEANNLAINGVVKYFKNVLGMKNLSVVTSEIEHHSIINALKAVSGEVEVRFVKPRCDGYVDAGSVSSAIDESTVLVCMMMANNETGVIMPYEQVGELCARRGVLFHCDAVCASGKLKYDVKKFHCDTLSVSSHKLYGPKGAACLYKRRGVSFLPMIFGGHQENDMRAGTENLHSIAGFSAACLKANNSFDSNIAHYEKLKKLFILNLHTFMPCAVLNVESFTGLANTVSVSFDFADEHEANAFMFNLDTMGLYVSSGAACASLANLPSHVLLAMGINSLRARSSLRISFGTQNSEDEIIKSLEIIKRAYEMVKRFGKA